MFEVGKTYPDGRGWQVEIIYDLGSGTHPIVGIAREGQIHILMSYTKDGFHLEQSQPTSYDLIQPEVSYYVVASDDGSVWCTYSDKDTAISHYKDQPSKTIWRCVRKEQVK